MMPFAEIRNQLPKKTGVYLMLNKKGQVLYVGKARNLAERVSWYFKDSQTLEAKTQQLVSQVMYFDYIETVSEFDALLLEAALIKRYKPKYNVIWRDDKHPLYIKITTGEEFPKVTTVRREEEKNATYFGPFPSSRITRQVLKLLRRIFPYCTQKRIGRPCFYTHLGLCNPCPSEIVKLPPEKRRQEALRYRLSIRRLIRVLSGKTDQVLNGLEKEMKNLAKTQRFEEAALVRNQIARLRLISQQRLAVMDYLTNPNLAAETRKKELRQLREWLFDCQVKYSLPFSIPRTLDRIESIDVSNILGKYAVGSLVVFVGGEADRSAYRRFRIRKSTKANDPEMIAEVVKRRFSHPEWPFPQLLLIDGGKGQVSAAIKVCQKQEVLIPILGLTKRFEELILPLAKGGFIKKRLPNSSGALYLLQRLRDEAHRFAHRYHRHLRLKKLTGGRRLIFT